MGATVHDEDGSLTQAVNFPFDKRDDDGSIEHSQDFPYDEVDGNLDGVALGKEKVSIEEIQAAVKGLQSVLGWIWQDGMQDQRGISIRATIACWVFLTELQPMTMSKMARGLAMKKQSLGRWHDEFKKKYPHIKTPHMKNEEKNGKQ